MPDSIDLRSIGKFDGTKFQAWKFQMRAIFIANKLMEIVYGIKQQEEAISEVTRDEWDKSNYYQSNDNNLSDNGNLVA